MSCMPFYQGRKICEKCKFNLADKKKNSIVNHLMLLAPQGAHLAAHVSEMSDCRCQMSDESISNKSSYLCQIISDLYETLNLSFWGTN